MQIRIEKSYKEPVYLIIEKEELSETRIENNYVLNDYSLLSNEPDIEIDITKKELSFDYDFDYVVRVVAQEAGTVNDNESICAQMAIAQCIKNTSEKKGISPEKVVKTPNQYAKPVDKNRSGLDVVRESCIRVFVNGETITDEPIQYFYSTSGGFVSNWHENSLIFVTKIGPTKFFKTKS